MGPNILYQGYFKAGASIREVYMPRTIMFGILLLQSQIIFAEIGVVVP